MYYIEFTPSVPLQKYIAAFWSSKQGRVSTTSTIVPDGCVDIIFQQTLQPTHGPTHSMRIAGMQTKFRVVQPPPFTNTFGIRFNAGQLGSICNVPISEIKNTSAEATNCISHINTEFVEQLFHKKKPVDQVKIIETHLLRYLDPTLIPNNQLIHSVCNTIKKGAPNINIHALAQAHHISLRQLERKFKASIGISMKEFHGVERFKNTVKSIKANPNMSLLHIAYDNGFYDHAHLSKEFLKMTGNNPSQF